MFRCICPSTLRYSELVASHRQLRSPLEVLRLDTGSLRSSYRSVSTALQSRSWARDVAHSSVQREWSREAHRHARLPLCPPEAQQIHILSLVHHQIPPPVHRASKTAREPPSAWRSIPSWTAQFQLKTNQEVVVWLVSCCCSHCCFEVREIPPHPLRQQCSCIDSLFACVPTFRSDHSSPQNLGLFSCLPLCFPLPLSMPFLPLACWPFLPFHCLPQVSSRCVLSSGGTLFRSTAHLTCTPRVSPLEVSYSLTSLSNTISVTPAGSCPNSKCLIPCSCARERACERGLHLRARSRNASSPLGCCRMICSAGPLVNMTSRYLSCASMSWFKGSHGIQTLACAASSAAYIIRPSWRSTSDTQERNLKLQSPHVLSSPENTSGFQFSCRWLRVLQELSVVVLLRSVLNRRTSLNSVCTISASLCRSASACAHCSAVTFMISPSTRFHLPNQRQFRYQVKRR